MDEKSSNIENSFCNIQTVLDYGNGRATVLLVEENSWFLKELEKNKITLSNRVVILSLPVVNYSDFELLAKPLEQYLLEKNIRHCSLIALGEASAFGQALSLYNPKFVRTLVLVDATCRSHPTKMMKIFDKIERALPLGLPFRSGLDGVDVQPYLQRIRCPVLVVKTKKATSYQSKQAELLAHLIPTAWLVELKGDSLTDELNRLLLEFSEVQAKCPQKNVQAAAKA